MPEAVRIRAERPPDHDAVRTVVTLAFGRTDEARLLDTLRSDGDAAITLVAEADGQIAGHVLLSPMQAPFRALGLAPLAVAPPYAGRGIGAALVGAALDAARAQGWEAVFVLGDPAYYTRFGFTPGFAAPFASPYAGPAFMALPLSASIMPTGGGAVAYAPAFSAL